MNKVVYSVSAAVPAPQQLHHKGKEAHETSASIVHTEEARTIDFQQLTTCSWQGNGSWHSSCQLRLTPANAMQPRKTPRLTRVFYNMQTRVQPQRNTSNLPPHLGCPGVRAEYNSVFEHDPGDRRPRFHGLGELEARSRQHFIPAYARVGKTITWTRLRPHIKLNQHMYKKARFSSVTFCKVRTRNLHEG